MNNRVAIAALVLFTLTLIGEVYAAGCPIGTRYVCHQSWGGKVVCSCQ
jgi:hypothetical protein